MSTNVMDKLFDSPRPAPICPPQTTNCRPCHAACSTSPISSCSQWRQHSCRSLCLSGWPWWWSLSAMLPQNSTTNTVWTLLVSQSSSQHFMEVCGRICFMEKIEYPRHPYTHIPTNSIYLKRLKRHQVVPFFMGTMEKWEACKI